MIRAITLLIVLNLAVAGVTLGAARGQVRLDGQIVLCSGSAHVVQTIDNAGQPLRRPGICPDMALALLGSLAVAPPALPMRATAGSRLRAPRPVLRVAAADVGTWARGPPPPRSLPI